MNTLILYCLVLTLVLVQSHSMFKDHFNNPELYKLEIAKLQDDIEKERLKRTLAEYNNEKFKVEVAKVLPQAFDDAPSGEAAYPLRRLASVVTENNHDTLRESFARNSFEIAKKHFRNKDLIKAKKLLNDFVQEQSYSVHVAEAYFLLSEIHFQLEDYESCLKTVESMLNVFPDSELTGYALLRAAKIYEYQNRPEDAIDIYKTLLRSFPDRGIASQASQSLRSIDL